MDEKLEQVLHKVKLLCEQNPKFATALKEYLGLPIGGTPESTKTTQLDKIEKYLGLDYKLDTIYIQNTYYEVDYSFISLSSVREMMESDYREMMRYRYGTRSHKADFYEFCKYAHYQLEAIANEFLASYSLRDDTEEDVIDIDIAKEFIKCNWPEKLDQPRFKDKVSDVKDIDYFQKITAIITFLKISTETISYSPHIAHSLSDVIGYIRRIRNDISHRSIQQEKAIEKEINNFEKTISKLKIGNTEYYNFGENRVVKDYLWRKQTPWDDVIKVIIILCNSIKNQMV